MPTWSEAAPMRSLGALALCFVLLAGLAPALASDAPRRVYLGSATIDISREAPHPVVTGRGRELRTSAPWQYGGTDERWGAAIGREQVFVAASGPVTEELKSRLATILHHHGGALGHYIPDDAFMAVAGEAGIAALAADPGVAWVGAVRPEHKLSPSWEPVLAASGACGEEGACLARALEGLDWDTAAGTVNVGVKLAAAADRSHCPGCQPAGLPTPLPPADPAAAAAAEWPQGMCPLLGGEGCLVVRKAADYVVVSAPAATLAAALAEVASHPAVYWVEPRVPVTTSNYYSSAIIQSGSTDIAQYTRASARPVWDLGLRGQGHIVGIGDTGLDLKSCFFMDAEGVPPGPDHRKVEYYREYQDGRDDFQFGHGTHVSGILAGKSIIIGGSKNNGMVPEARIGFTDLSKSSTGSLDTDSTISLPKDLNKDYYQYAYDRGVRVHSDSWGSAQMVYTEDSQEVDRFMWEHQDFVGVMAAGNHGAGTSVNSATVTSPGTSKNGICVGATLTAEGPAPFKEVDVLDISVKYRGGLLSACATLSNKEALDGKVAVVSRAGPEGGEACSFAAKARAAQEAGAVAVLIWNDDIRGFFPVGDAGETEEEIADLSIPVGALPGSTYTLFRREFDAGRPVDLSFRFPEETAARFENMAEFSSVGPTKDGRIKPDLMAPGENVRSADSQDNMGGGHCRTKIVSGTSMSAPVVAGAAVLVRQYFLDGFYPRGNSREGTVVQPSGALVKAVLINGAHSMTGFTEQGYPLDPPPSVRQGWGRVHLSQSLVLPGGDIKGMYVVDRRELSLPGESREVCFRVRESGSPLRVTLAWHDYPGALNAGGQLVNDLDLVMRSDALIEPLYAAGSEPDRTNNVEKIGVERAGAGQYVVDVSAFKVPEGPQPYALVITGDITDASNTCDWGSSVKVGGGPVGLVAEGSPSFTFTVSTEGAAPMLQCQLTNGAGEVVGPGLHDWEDCASPRAYPGLPDGAYKFLVRPAVQVNDATRYGIADARSFVVDTSPPATALLAPLPAATSPEDRADFSFTSADSSDVVTYCRLRGPGELAGAEWEPCTSPVSYENLVNPLAPRGPATFTFEARGVDAAGNEEPEGAWAVHTWNINVLAPHTAVAGGPYPARTRARDISFALEAPGGGEAGFECALALAGAALEWGPCSSPASYTALGDGRYTFHTRAYDAQGNRDTTPGSVSFEVDTAGPTAYLRVTPPRLVTSSAAVFHFFAEGSRDADVTFECALAGGPAGGTGVAAGCASPASYRNLLDGFYSFSLVARDDLENASPPAEYQFQVDLTPPEVAVSALSPARDVSANWTVGDPGSGILRVECKLWKPANDYIATTKGGSNWAECASPFTRPGSEMEEGDWLLSIRATDQADNVGDEIEVPIVIDVTGPAVSRPQVVDSSSVFVDSVSKLKTQYVRDASFTFEASDPGSGVASTECMLLVKENNRMVTYRDWAACSSPFKVKKLVTGQYSLVVRGKDNLGNVGGQSVASAILAVRVVAQQSWAEKNTAAVAAAGIGGGFCFLMCCLGCLKGIARDHQFNKSLRTYGLDNNGRRSGIRGSSAPRSFADIAAANGAFGDTRTGPVDLPESEERELPPGTIVCQLCGAEAPNEATYKLHLEEHAVLEGVTINEAGEVVDVPAGTVAIDIPEDLVGGGEGEGGGGGEGGGEGGARGGGGGGEGGDGEEAAQNAPPAAPPAGFVRSNSSAREPPEEPKLTCPICQKKYRGLEKLNLHIDLEHGEPVTPVAAAADDLAAFLAGDEEEEQEAAAGGGEERRITCALCGAGGFRDAAELTHHADTAHPIGSHALPLERTSSGGAAPSRPSRPPPPPPAAPTRPPPPPPPAAAAVAAASPAVGGGFPGEKYTCPMCQKVCRDLGDLNDHIDDEH